MCTGAEIEAETKRLKDEFDDLFATIEAILFGHDPIAIAFYDDQQIALNPDEYSPEVRTILPRLIEAKTPHHLTTIIHEEFVKWFSAEVAGERERYVEIGYDIWVAYKDWARCKDAK